MFELIYFLLLSMVSFSTTTDPSILQVTSSLSERNRTYMLFVSEDASIGHTQLIDTFDNPICILYSISSTIDQRRDSPFEIQLTMNQTCQLNLRIIRLLDREQTPMYTLKREFIRNEPFDNNDSILIQLSIVILDVNDHVPQFETDHFHFNIREDVPAHSRIGQARAHDPDAFMNGKITYTLFGDDLVQYNNRTMFRLDSETGELFLNQYTLDFETKREYSLMIEAKDHGDSEATVWPSAPSYADVVITVEDVNDHKPEIILTMPSESTDDETVKIVNISRIRLDKEPNQFVASLRSSISSVNNNPIEMVHLVREEPLPADVLLALIHLRDGDETANGDLSLELETFVRCASDNFTLCSMPNFFRLSPFRPNVYGLFTMRILDRDQYENYMLHLIGSDNGNRPIGVRRSAVHRRLSSSLNIRDFLQRRTESTPSPPLPASHLVSLTTELFVHISLLDINDNAPIFDQPYIQVAIDENQPRTTFVTRVHAHDLDKGRNGTVRYELVVKQHQIFHIDARSGVLRTRRILDREHCAFYRVGIRAHDLGYPNWKYSAIAIVDVHVNNLNDHVPYFMHETFHFEIDENLPAGTIVGQVTTDDRDEQEPAEQMINLSTIEGFDGEEFNSTLPAGISTSINSSAVNFLFVDSGLNESSSGQFSIDNQGIIRTLTMLDRELQASYILSIFLYDLILKAYSLPSQVTIEVLDENDNLPFEPILSKNDFILNIEINDFEPTMIYQFKPTDLDDGPNGFVSIDCVNCTSSLFFHVIIINETNTSILMTRTNVSIPDGMYSLGILLRDHGLRVHRERFYILQFNITHRNRNNQLMTNLTLNRNFFAKNENLFWNLFGTEFRWKFLVLLAASWLVLVAIALWTCYRYDRSSIEKQKIKQRQQELETQVRQHEIIGQAIRVLPRTPPSTVSCLRMPMIDQEVEEEEEQQQDKEPITQDEDEIEDTSYDADYVITDANFVLTSGCASSEALLRNNGNGVHFGYLPSNNNLSANLNSINIRTHTPHSISFSRLHNSCSRCQLSSSMMNSRETMLTDAATNTSNHENEDEEIPWQQTAHNNNRMLYENAITTLNNDYQFEPIDHDFPPIDHTDIPPSIDTTQHHHTNSHLLKRPIPVNNNHYNTVVERPRKYHNHHQPQQQQQQQYVLTTKRNSSVDIDSASYRPGTFPRSITSDHLGPNANNRSTTSNNRLYYYPSVQDVLDALNRRSFDKESFV